mgnify:CR=1 FL=1|jgi:HAD superfamily hydrolase (TIGR01509 family)
MVSKLCIAATLVASASALRVPKASALRVTSASPRCNNVRMKTPNGMAILFDCDGVLADTERDGHRVSFNKAFAENGWDYEWSVDEYGRMCEVGGGKERMTAFWNGFNGYCTTGWPEGYKTPMTEETEGPKGLPLDPDRLALVKEMHARKTALFQELLGTGIVPLRPGILSLVDEAIEADVPMAVCSTSNEAAVRTLVETLMGPERYAKFDFFCGDCVPRKKPNPDVYNLAAETMGLEKSECVVIEDSGIGNQAGKAAGMAVLVTKSTYTVDEDFTGADRIVNELEADGITLADLRALLK